MRLGFNRVPAMQDEEIWPLGVHMHIGDHRDADRGYSVEFSQIDFEKSIARSERQAFPRHPFDFERAKDLQVTLQSGPNSCDTIFYVQETHIALSHIACPEDFGPIEKLDGATTDRRVFPSSCSDDLDRGFGRDVGKRSGWIVKIVVPVGDVVGGLCTSFHENADRRHFLFQNVNWTRAGNQVDLLGTGFQDNLRCTFGKTLSSLSEPFLNVQCKSADSSKGCKASEDSNCHLQATATQFDYFDGRIGAEVSFQLRYSDKFTHEKKGQLGLHDTIKLDEKAEFVLSRNLVSHLLPLLLGSSLAQIEMIEQA